MKLNTKNLFKAKTDSGAGNVQKEISHLLAIWALPVFVIAFSIVSIRYFWELRGYNNTVIGVSEEARDVAAKNLQSVSSLKSSLTELEGGDYGSKEVLDALPSKYDYLALSTSIEKIAIQNGLTIEDLTGEDLTAEVEEEAFEPQPEPMRLMLEVRGSYEEIQNLIRSLESSIRPMQVTKMELTGDVSSMKAELEITTYYQLSESLQISTKKILIDNQGSY